MNTPNNMPLEATELAADSIERRLNTHKTALDVLKQYEGSDMVLPPVGDEPPLYVERVVIDRQDGSDARAVAWLVLSYPDRDHGINIGEMSDEIDSTYGWVAEAKVSLNAMGGHIYVTEPFFDDTEPLGTVPMTVAAADALRERIATCE